MTLRKVLIIPFIISIIFFAIFSAPIFGDMKMLIQSQITGSIVIWLVVVALIVQFLAHILRAYKMRLLMKPTVKTSVGLQFNALSIGYLFDMILPFRIGELIRAQVIAFTKSVSFGFSLILVIIERIVDLIFLALFGILFIFLGILPMATIPYIVIMVIIGGLILTLLVMMWREYPPLMVLVKKSSNIFNDTLKVQLRFKYWSIVYGLQQTITKERILKYLLLSFGMWIGYALSVLILLIAIRGVNFSFVQTFSPFYAMSVPSGPANLGSFSNVYLEFTKQIADISKVQILITWAFLVIPMGIVGLYNLAFLKVPIWRKLQKGSDTDDLVDKLSRRKDISQDLALFLDNYLDGNSLSQIVNRRERHDEFKLIRYFKGGSDAITILVNKRAQNVVEKIIALDLKDRLKAQYDWLTQYKDTRIVQALGEETGSDYYAIDLDYNQNNEMFFDYIHRSSLKDSKRVLGDIWVTLNRTVHKKTKLISDNKSVVDYIDKHFYGCLEKSLEVSEDLKAVIGQDKITINGKQYLNAYSVMKKITTNKKIMDELGTYESSGAVHGDVIVDNVLVDDAGKVTIIDPAPDGNIINGRVFDFGKNMQSFYCGYEFLFRANEPALLGDDGSISYHDQRSLRYMQLSDYIQKTLAPKYLTDAERRSMIFHAGVLMIRRLKHQVYQDPRLTLAMYAAGVKALNDFYLQYEAL